MKISTRIKVALPCILIGAALGALVGGSLGDTANGIRAGIILGGVVAIIYLQRKQSGSS
jgi:hypothetical protein